MSDHSRASLARIDNMRSPMTTIRGLSTLGATVAVWIFAI